MFGIMAAFIFAIILVIHGIIIMKHAIIICGCIIGGPLIFLLMKATILSAMGKR